MQISFSKSLLTMAALGWFALAGAPLALANENVDERAADPVERPEIATSQTTDPADTKDLWGGGLSDEEFKQLHDLPLDQAPPLHGTMVPLGNGQAYLSLPKDRPAPLPAMLVIHEWWGLNDHIKHWSDRLAAEGYAVLAVDLYGGKVATDGEGAMALMKTVDPGAAKQTIRAALDFLEKDPGILASGVGSIGWCFGGHWSLETALLAPELKACVLYYGQPVTDPAALKAIHAEVLGVFGTQDPSIPAESVKAFEDGLKTAGVQARILRYDAPHAFANPSNPKYDEKSSSHAWKEVKAFLKAELGPAPAGQAPAKTK